MRTVVPADELRHDPGDEPYWNESFYLDFHTATGDLGGYVRLGLYPNLGVSWYWACLVGEGRRLHIVVEHTAPVPRPPSLEVRASGLWADINVEEPLEHVSVGLEAFALALDDPSDIYHEEPRGERVPFGLDLSWETDGTPFGYEVTTRYEIPCRVSGEVLVGDETVAFDGYGQRDHSHGVRDWWADEWMWMSARLDQGQRLHAVGSDGSFGIGYRQDGGHLTHEFTSVAARPTLGENDIPTGAVLDTDDGVVAIEPLAWAPVRLDSPRGEVAHFPRALCRVADQDHTGVGWIEFNQPPGFVLGR